MKILIDTDVILDFFFDRKPFSEHAELIFKLSETKRMSGYITPVICSNVYYILRQGSRHEKVIQKLSQLLRIINVLSMDEEVVVQAMNSEFRDFEDALQNYSAVNSGIIDVILTRNVRDYKRSKLSVMTPESFLQQMTA